MNATELYMRRRLVSEFIGADLIVLELVRKNATPPEKTLAGGYLPSGLPEDIPPQRARIVQNRRRYNNGIVNSEAGDIPHTDYLLLGMHTLDVEAEDTFVWQGEHYKVTGIHKQRIESTLCSIEMDGGTNRA